MAFGDVIQTNTGTNSTPPTLLSAPAAGNSLLLFTYLRSYEGGKPSSVADDVNAGNYTEIYDTNQYVNDRQDVQLYLFADCLASIPTVAFTGSTGASRWVFLEVEGELASASNGGAAFEHATQSGTITVASDTIPANSVSFGSVTHQFASRDLAVTDGAWSEIADNSTLEVHRRTDTSSTSSSLSGSVTGGNEYYAVGWASFTAATSSETATTGNIPLVIQAGYTLVDLVDPVTTNASLLFGVTGDAPVTGDHVEYDVTSTLDSGVTLSVAATGVWTVTEATEGDWVTDITVSRRVVQADGTIGTEAVVTLSAPTSTASGLTIVTDMVSNIVSNMVN